MIDPAQVAALRRMRGESLRAQPAPQAQARSAAPAVRRGGAYFGQRQQPTAWNGDPTGGAQVAQLGAGMQRPGSVSGMSANDPNQQRFSRDAMGAETPSPLAEPQRTVDDPYATRRSTGGAVQQTFGTRGVQVRR